MNETPLKIGQSVRLVGKQLEGRVAYIGATNFANGKWIGVILTQPLGKNNGSVQGVSYFKCSKNYGIFVRPTQLIPKRPAQNSIMDNEEISGQVESRLVKSKTKPSRKLMTTEANPTPLQDGTALSSTKAIEQDAVVTSAPVTTTISTSVSPVIIQSDNTDHGQVVGKQPEKLPSEHSYLFNNEHYPVMQVPTTSALVTQRSKTFMSSSSSFQRDKPPIVIAASFSDILRPRFTIVQPLRSPTGAGSFSLPPNANKNHILQLQQQIKELHNKLIDCKKEIAELKNQNSDFQLQLVDMQQLRSENEQLLASKEAFSEQQAITSKEMDALESELRQSNDMKTEYMKQLDDAKECIDLLTLDKQIFEERNEIMQMELEVLREKNQLFTLDVEILKVQNEQLKELSRRETTSLKAKDYESLVNAAKGNNASPSASASASDDLRKLETHNDRLWQTVLKLCHVLTLEKQNSQKLTKDLNTSNSEIAELKKSKQHLSQRSDQLESQLVDMREQIEAATSSESILTALTNAKFELEDKVHMLEEEVAELEALEEIHEQLVESNQELEKDLREEIAQLNGQVRQLLQEKDNALQGLYERECTIMKFRALIKTQNANDSSKETTAEMDTEIEANEKFIANADFHQLFANTKAYGQSIDLQLAVLEAKIANSYVDYMKAFLPDDVLLPGGVHDLISVLLLLQRTMQKIELICASVSEKFPAYCDFDRIDVYECYSVQRYAFRTRCLYLLRSLHMILQQFEYSLNYGIYEVCLHAAMYRSEMESKEHCIDDFINLLKKGLFDENTVLDNIELAYNFYSTLLHNQVNNSYAEDLLDERLLNVTLIGVYDMAMDCIDVNARLLYNLVQIDDDDDEHMESESESQSFSCLQKLIENAKQFKQQLKHIQKQLPDDCLGFTKMPASKMQHLDQRLKHLNKLISLLNVTLREASKSMTSSYSNNNNSSSSMNETSGFMSVDQEALWRLMNSQCCRLAPELMGERPCTAVTSFFEHFVQLMQQQMDDYQHFIIDGKKARSSNLNTFYIRSNDITIFQQAAELKQRYDKVKQLQQQLALKDSEIKSLKHLVKTKQNDYSELRIRKDLIERNLHKLDSDHQQFLLQLANKTNDILDDIQNRHIHIMQILDSHEDKLHELEKLQLVMNSHMALRNRSISTTTHAAGEEIDKLHYCLRKHREYACLQRVNEMKTKLKRLEPLYAPNRKDGAYQQQFQKLSNNLKLVKNAWILQPITSNSQMSPDVMRQKAVELSQDIWEFYSQMHEHRFVSTHFGRFLTSDMRQVFD